MHGNTMIDSGIFKAACERSCVMTSVAVILLTGKQPDMNQAQCCSNLVDWQANWTRQGAIAQLGTGHTLPAGKSMPWRAPWEPFTAEVWKEVGGVGGQVNSLPWLHPSPVPEQQLLQSCTAAGHSQHQSGAASCQ